MAILIYNFLFLNIEIRVMNFKFSVLEKAKTSKMGIRFIFQGNIGQNQKLPSYGRALNYDVI